MDIAGYEEVLDLYGYGERNPEVTLFQILKTQRLRILNSYCQKDRGKQITSKTGEAETQIYFKTIRPKPVGTATTCTTIPDEAFLT